MLKFSRDHMWKFQGWNKCDSHVRIGVIDLVRVVYRQQHVPSVCSTDSRFHMFWYMNTKNKDWWWLHMNLISVTHFTHSSHGCTQGHFADRPQSIIKSLHNPTNLFPELKIFATLHKICFYFLNSTFMKISLVLKSRHGKSCSFVHKSRFYVKSICPL